MVKRKLKRKTKRRSLCKKRTRRTKHHRRHTRRIRTRRAKRRRRRKVGGEWIIRNINTPDERYYNTETGLETDEPPAPLLEAILAGEYPHMFADTHHPAGTVVAERRLAESPEFSWKRAPPHYDTQPFLWTRRRGRLTPPPWPLISIKKRWRREAKRDFQQRTKLQNDMRAEGMSPQLITSILSKDNCWGHGKIRLICPPGFVVKGKDAYGCDGYCVGEDEDAVIVETQRAFEQAAYDKEIAKIHKSFGVVPPRPRLVRGKTKSIGVRDWRKGVFRPIKEDDAGGGGGGN